MCSARNLGIMLFQYISITEMDDSKSWSLSNNNSRDEGGRVTAALCCLCCQQLPFGKTRKGKSSPTLHRATVGCQRQELQSSGPLEMCGRLKGRWPL